MKKQKKNNSSKNLLIKEDGMYLVLGCVHAPFVNKPFWKAMLKLAKERKQDIKGLILNGDFLDLHSLSAYDKGKLAIDGINLGMEYEGGRAYLDSILKVLNKDIYKGFIYGNHECFDIHTELLTIDGWVNIYDAKEDDVYVSYNMENESLEYIKPTKFYKEMYNGELHYYRGNKVDVAVTPNHKLMVRSQGEAKKYALKYSKDIKEKCQYFKVAVENTQPEYSISDDLIKLAAWIHSDGSVVDNKDSKSYRLFQSKQATSERIEQILQNLNLSYSKNTRERGISEICGVPISSCLPSNEYYIHTGQIDIVQNKYLLGGWVSKLSERQFLIFLEEFVLGDGSKHKSAPDTSWMIYGVKNIIEQLQILCFKNNISSTIIEYRENQFRLNINIGRNETKLNSGKKKNFEPKPYNNYVWCIENANGTVVTRRNGKISIQGNCRYHKYMKDINNSKLGNALPSPEVALGLKEKGFDIYLDWVNDEIQLGDLTTIHGEYCNVHVAKKYIDVFKRNFLLNHTHRLQMHREGEHVAYNGGSMADFKSPVFNYATKAMKKTWTNSFSIATLYKGKAFVEQPVWNENHFVYGGKIYS